MKRITFIITLVIIQFTTVLSQDLPVLPFSFYSQNGQLAMTVDKKIYTYHSSIKMHVTDVKKRVFGKKKAEGTQDYIFQSQNIIIDFNFGKKSTKNRERTVRVKATQFEKEVLETRAKKFQEVKFKIASKDYSIRIYGLDVIIPVSTDNRLNVAYDGVKANQDIIYLAFTGKLNRIKFKGGVYYGYLSNTIWDLAYHRGLANITDPSNETIQKLIEPPLNIVLNYGIYDLGIMHLENPKYFISYSRLMYDYETEVKKDLRYELGYNDNLSMDASLFFQSLINNIYEKVY